MNDKERDINYNLALSLEYAHTDISLACEIMRQIAERQRMDYSTDKDIKDAIKRLFKPLN